MGDGACGESKARNLGYKCGVNDAFKSIAERKKFYEENIIEDTEEEYAGALIMMMKKNPELFKEFSKQDKLSWKDWLFHYCFDEVK